MKNLRDPLRAQSPQCRLQPDVAIALVGVTPMDMSKRCARPDASAKWAHPLALPSSRSWLGTPWICLVALTSSYVAHYSAAAVYSKLSGLSDRELMRLGLSRETLARDLNHMQRNHAAGYDPS